MDPYIFKLSPVAIAVPTLSFFTLVIDAPSFAWHIKNRNLAASCLVFWVMLNNLFNFIDSIIWHNDNIATWWHGEVYCDIQVKLFLASQLGLTGSAASVMRSLAIALNTERMVLRASTAQRHRKLALDLLLCFGLPLYMIVIHYIIQPSRYYIIAIAGCTPSFQSTWPAFLLAYIWPLLSCLLAGYYSGLVIVRLRKYRKDFSAILTSSNPGLTKSRFIRLFLAALFLIVLCIPVQVYVFYNNANYPLVPYSWSEIHGPTWWNIILIPTYGSVSFDRWIQIGLGIVVFACFGVGQDAIAMYRKWLLQAGMGKIFPRLRTDCLPSYSTACSPGTISTYSSKVRGFIGRKLSHGHSTGTSNSRNPSTVTALSTPSPTDPEKSFPRLESISENPSVSTLSVPASAEKTSAQQSSNSPPASTFQSWFRRSKVRIFHRAESRPAMETQISHDPSTEISAHDWVAGENSTSEDVHDSNGHGGILVDREIEVID